MKFLSFTSPAVVLGLLFFGIVPPFQDVTAKHHSQSASDNTKDADHQEELSIDQEAGLKPDASMFLLRAHGSTLSNRNLLNSSCNDSPLKVLTGKARKSAKTCEYIAAQRKKLCKGRVIKSHCPDACGVCESFGTADSEATFMYDGAKTDCAWLHGFLAPSTLWQISVLCEVDAIRETCRHTCSFFFHSCAMCSTEPTSRPSLEVMSNMPSSLPSTSSSSFPSTLPSKTPSTSPTTSLASPSTLPSSSPTTSCPDKIASIIDKHFGDVVKGPPQEKAYTWLIDDIADECDDEAMIVQRYILAVLYFSTGGEDWSHSYGYDYNWLESTNECDWLQVSCNGNQQVRTVVLYDSNLNGTIPAELGSLTDLEQLHLDDNYLSGSIPGSIFDLPQLEGLYLSYNDLTGTIPDNFGGSNSLIDIYLHDNLLTGTIPEITGDSLQSIEWLYLNWNKMSGPVPDSLCDLRSSKPDQFTRLYADCAPRNNAQNPCPSGCCTDCTVGKGLP